MRVVASLGVPRTDPVAAAHSLAAVAAGHELVITHAPDSADGPASAIARALAATLRPRAVATLLTQARLGDDGVVQVVEQPSVEALLDAGIVAVCEAEDERFDPALASAALAAGLHADVLLLLTPDPLAPNHELAAARFRRGGGRAVIGRLHDAAVLLTTPSST
jgi:hypothetical protein